MCMYVCMYVHVCLYVCMYTFPVNMLQFFLRYTAISVQKAFTKLIIEGYDLPHLAI